MQIVKITDNQWQMNLSDDEAKAIAADTPALWQSALQLTIDQRVAHMKEQTKAQMMQDIDHLSSDDVITLQNIMRRGRANRVESERQRAADEAKRTLPGGSVPNPRPEGD